MELKLSLLADYANVTGEGKLNIMGIFNAIPAPQFPVVHAQMVLVLTFEARASEANRVRKLDISFRDADGKTLFTIGADMAIPKPLDPSKPMHLNHMVQLQGLRFEKPGEYVFDILVDGDRKGSVPLHVLGAPVT